MMKTNLMETHRKIEGERARAKEDRPIKTKRKKKRDEEK